MAQKEPKVAVLGAGLAGMCMAIKLKQAGICNFTIYEKAETVGGTWRDNKYPGVACDVPSHLYSFSFARNPNWSQTYSGGKEIQDYCERVTDFYGVRPFMQFNKKVEAANYKNGQWEIHFADGSTDTADVLVSALGGLHHPSIPEIDGRDTFKGEAFHSAEWNSKSALKGKRVGIIGNAASAVQIVPEIVDDVASLTVFQRTPNWIFPRENKNYSRFSRFLYRYFPFITWCKRALLYLRAEVLLFPLFRENSWMQKRMRKMATDHIKELVPDEALQKKLIPDYPVGCKRILFIDDYLESLQKPNASLETNGIKSITSNGITTQDGTAHALDVIIYATGFKPFDFLDSFTLTGVGGVSLKEHWKNKVESHRTVAVAGFPNFFMLLGPNSGLGHNSVLLMIEAQVKYIVGCVQAIRKHALKRLEPKRDLEKGFNTQVQAGLVGSVWAGSCKSWYKGGDSDNFTLWPWSVTRYIREMRQPDLREYQTERNQLDAAE